MLGKLSFTGAFEHCLAVSRSYMQCRTFAPPHSLPGCVMHSSLSVDGLQWLRATQPAARWSCAADLFLMWYLKVWSKHY